MRSNEGTITDFCRFGTGYTVHFNEYTGKLKNTRTANYAKKVEQKKNCFFPKHVEPAFVSPRRETASRGGMIGTSAYILVFM